MSFDDLVRISEFASVGAPIIFLILGAPVWWGLLLWIFVLGLVGRQLSLPQVGLFFGIVLGIFVS